MKKRLVTALSLFIGGSLFALVIRQTGANQLLARLSEIGWGFGWILFVSGLRSILRSAAWLRSLPEEHRRVGFFSIWRARVIGDAVGNLTTAGPLLAEPARLIYFNGQIPIAAAAGSLSIELLTYIASCAVVMSAGLALLLARFAIEPSLRTVSITALVALLLALVITAIALVRRWSLSSLLGSLIEQSGSEHPSLDWIDRQLQHLYRIENDIFDFYRRRPNDFLIVCGCEAAFHVAGVIEIWITLELIHEQPAVITVFIFEAINRLITMSFSFIPARVGVDEAGTGLLAVALGFDALVGVTMAIYRKLRVLFWTAAGLALLAAHLKRQERVS